MTQESRLVIRVDSKPSEQQVKDLDKALNLLERTGLSVTRTAKTTSNEITALGRGSETATRSVDRATAVWSKFNSVVALAGVSLSAVAAINMYRSVAANVESLRLFSEQIGISTEQLSSLRYAADDMAGVSSRTLDPALRRMTRRIQEAANESGPAANALKMLRLEAKKLSELDVESQLYAVADAMKELPNHADKLRATMAIFDTEGMPLVNMLNKGADAIKAAQLEAEKLNQTISQVDADRVGRLNSEFSKISAQLEGIKTQTAIGILPAVEGLSTGLGVLAENFDTVAKVTGGVALVALSRYAGGLLEARAQTIKSILEKRNAARAELDLARAQQMQTAETLRQTLALNAQNVTRIQTQTAIQADIAARARLTAAEAAMTRQVTASTAAMGLARSALGLVGGPFGALTLAVTAGAGAWYGYQQRLEESKAKFQSMIVPVAQLREELAKLNQDQLELEQFEISPKVREFEKQTQDLALAIQSIEKDYKALSESSAVTQEELENVKRTLIETRIEYSKSAEDLELLKLRQEEGAKILAKFKEAALSAGKGLAEFSTEVKGLSETDFTKLISGLQQSLDVIGMSTQQAAEYKARLEGANDEQARLAGVLAGMADAARQVEKATQEKDDKAVKGAQALLDKLIEQEVQIRINMVRQAEYAALVAMGIEATIATQGADTAAELAGLKAQEEIVARIKSITSNITKNTVPSLKKTGSATNQLSGEIDNLVGSLFPAIKAEKEWTKQQKFLDQALKQGKISQDQHAKGLEKIREQYELIAFEAPKHVKALQDEAKSLKASIPSLRDRVKNFGLSAAAITRQAEAETRASLATARNTLTTAQASEASEERVRQLKQEIKALEDLAEQQAKVADYTAQSERLEAEKQHYQDVADEAKRTHDEIERSLTDSLMRSFESGKGFAKSFLDSIKSLASTLILRPIVQPISEGIAGAVTGALGMGKGGGFGLFDGLGMASNLNSLAGAFSGSLVSSMGSGIASLGTAFGSSAMTSFAAGMKGSTLAAGLAGPTTAGAGGAMGAGAAFASVAPWLAGGLAAYSLVSSLVNKGETRSGGGFQYTPANDSTFYGGGPSGGYGGDATLSAVDALLRAQYQTINSVIEGVGAQNIEIASIVGSFESSKKGRGGTSSGGQIIIDGQSQYFGSINDQGHLVKGQGYGGKSGSAEEMFANLQAEVHFSALEAWKAVGDKMPTMIRDMLDGVDVRALSVEQAQGLVEQITVTTGQVNQLITALDSLPLDSLKGLSFDLAGSLAYAAGGIEQLLAGSSSFYQHFYSEQERQQILMRQYESQIKGLGLTIADSREGHREMVEALNAADEGNHKMIGGLLNLSDVADQYYSILEQRASSFNAMTDNFRSDQEIFSRSGAELSEVLAGIGYSLPDSKRGFLQLLESIDKTTESGLEAAEVLLSVSSIAGNYYTELERLADEAMRNASESARKTEEELARQRDSISRAAEDIARSFTSVTNSIQGNIGSLYERITLDIMDSDEDKYNYYKNQFDTYAKQLSLSTDATEIQNLVSKMTSSASSAYNLLDEDVRKGGEGVKHLSALDDVQALASRQMQASMQKQAEMQAKHLDVALEKFIKLLEAALKQSGLSMNKAAGDISGAAQEFSYAIGSLALSKYNEVT